MAIIDAENQLTFGWNLAVSTNVAVVSAPLGFDLNEDFGAGGTNALGTNGGFQRPAGVPARKSPVPGMGEDMLMHFRVTTSFVANAGVPLVQFNACLSESPAPAGGGNFIVIGSSCATRHLIGARQHVGYRVEQLVAGNQFFVRFNPWTTPMGRDATFTQKEAKDLRWLLPAMTFPHFDTGAATTFFSAGAVSVRLVSQGDVFQNPAEFLYPAARTVK